MHRKVLMVAVAALTTACVTFAQQKPNFSGTWKLDVNKSDFGPVPGPTSQTEVISQNGDTITINVTAVTDEGKQYTIKFVADGKEVSVSPDSAAAHPAPEVTMQSVSTSWDGPVLVVNQKLTYGGDPVTGSSRYSLSPDGKVLTVDSNYASQLGDATRTFVYEKVDSSSAMASQSMPSATAASASSGVTSAAAASSASSATASKPDLSGTWVLDIAKSDFGQMPPPENRTDTIDDKDPSIKITVNETGQMGEMNFTMDLVTDGTTVAKWTIFGNEARSTAHWEGSTLVVKTDSKFQDDPVSFQGKYTLSPDGKTLNVQDHYSGPMGEGDAKLVFNKR
jgi:hypothetical protein